MVDTSKTKVKDVDKVITLFKIHITKYHSKARFYLALSAALYNYINNSQHELFDEFRKADRTISGFRIEPFLELFTAEDREKIEYEILLNML